MSQFIFNNYDPVKQVNLTRALNDDNLTPPQIIAAIDEIIDNERDITLTNFKLETYPDSQNINAFIDNALHDLSNIKSSIVAIPSIASSQYNSTISGISNVIIKSGELQSKLNNLKLSIEKRGASNNYYSVIGFTSLNNVDINFPGNSLLPNIDTTAGIVTLQKITDQVLEGASFKVLKSNVKDTRDVHSQFPVNFFYEGLFYGHYQEVVAEGNNFHFNILNNPTRVLSEKATEEEITDSRSKVFDGDFDTSWFCERVTDVENTDNTPFQVTLLVDLGEDKTISNFTLTPYQLHQGDYIDIVEFKAGNDTSNLQDVDIFHSSLPDMDKKAGKANASSMPSTDKQNSVINLNFAPISSRYILLTLEQRHINITPYSLLNVKCIRKNPTNNTIESKIFTLGYIDTLALTIKESNIDPDKLLPALLNISGGWTITSDFGQTIKLDRSHSVIGISEIQVSDSNYSAISEFVTTKQVYPGNINKVSLEADSFIPKQFGLGNWIEYSISFDGNSFFRINPISVGSNIENIPNYITPNGDYNSLYVKVRLKRPDSALTMTPILKNIKLTVEIV